MTDVASSDTSKPGGPLAVLHNRKFTRLFLAGVTSISGFSIGSVALVWITYSKTGSPLDVASIGVSFITASVLFSLLAGALVDRHERKRLMIISDLIRALSMAGLMLSFFVVGFNLIILLSVAFILGSFTTLFDPAERSLTPEIVGSAQIAEANALVQTSASIARFASNAIAGVVIVVLGIDAAFALNSVTFLVSALLIGSIAGFAGSTKRVGSSPGSGRSSIVGDIKEGLGYIFRNRGLLELTVSAGLGNFFFAMVFQFFVVYSSQLLRGDAETYGVVLALLALGWGPGAFLAVRLKAVRFAGFVWIFSGIADGFCVIVLVLLPQLFVALAAVFVLGLLLGFSNTTWLTGGQLIVPTELQGRYFGIDQLGSFAVIPIGQVLGCLTISAFGVSSDFAVAGVGLIASSGIFLFSPYLRNLGWRPQGPA